jgi:hypothetical protein
MVLPSSENGCAPAVAIDIFSLLRCRLVDHAQSMIRKSGDRFSEKIMLKQKCR